MLSDADWKEVFRKRSELADSPAYHDAFEKAVVAMINRHAVYLVQKAMHSICPHPPELRHYFADASGNGDSYYECAVCGAELSE